ncbi:protein FAR-RED IMPAIRED RESPONSE 1 [Lathyrus oleraceus]|uniref:protein FAR-RED IMPAIRED RESPONSE 1 n=1 Tax=Pisum sativum TaxID=3888 RepID=UPI0021D3B6FB|nr:protein FAR-RED IMPAIRED RESPONSE 1-like [Pisum sativum]
MSTTQRSESIHAFFDGYINSTTSLNQFVKQYDNALRSQTEKEFEVDFNSMDTTIPCGSNSSIEKQFQSEFTNAKFKEIQVEFRSKMNYFASLNSMEGCFATYHMLEEILVGDIHKERVLKVVLDKENHDFKCECSLFEFRGIVCRHVLSVCSQERIIILPEKYVLTRWKKNIKRKHSYIKTSYGVTELKPQMDRFDKLCKHFYEVAEVVAESEETTKDLHETLHLFSSNMSTKDSALIEENINDDFNPINSNRIRSPKYVKRKGRLPSKRKTYVAETIAKRLRKRKKKECNIAMVGNQFGSNISVESSLEVVNGEHYLDSRIVVGNCMSFMDLLTTCETPLTGSSQIIQVEYSGGMLQDCKLNFVLIQIVNDAVL